MMTRKTARLGCLAAVICISLYGAVACSDDDAPARSNTPDATPGTDSSAPTIDSSTDGAPETIPVTIKFKAKVASQDFKCGTSYANQGSTNDTVEPRDLRFFVQDLALVDSSGNEVPVVLDARSPWQTSTVALLDFEDATGRCANGNPELNDVVTGRVPAGTYNGVAFTNGVPAEVNHVDPATEAAPLSAGGMTWGWLLGHLFIKAEVASTSTDGGVGLLHLGSVGCTNSSDGGTSDSAKAPTIPCSQPNRNRVKLAQFDPAANAIVLDVGAMFAASDLTAGSMCHSMGGACPPLFASVGLDYDGGARLSTAPAFHVE